MKNKYLLLLAMGLTACSSSSTSWQTQIDSKTTEKATRIINTVVLSNRSDTQGELIGKVSFAFLGTPYQADTLSGSSVEKEKLVANFNGVDCFTLIDYINALSLATKPEDFLPQLVKTRYINGEVDYLHRKHFFSDWYASVPRNAVDVTSTISKNALIVRKNINRKADGGEYIPGLGTIPREITYIPGKDIDETVLRNLKTGDFIGVYTPLAGLDVTHVGIAIKENGNVWFRNASSLEKNKKVVDSPLLDYMKTKPGMIVLRSVKDNP